jgi:glycosyltransferase involved in cell wall biosynthesis
MAREPEAPSILIVWQGLPCTLNGAGLLVRRLFAEYPEQRIWALTSEVSKIAAAPFQPIPPPDRQVAVREFQINRRVLNRLAASANYLRVFSTVRRGVELVREQQISAIFTIPWDTFFIAAYYIHKRTGCPLYVYAMDDPAGARSALQAPLYSYFMPRIMRASRRVWGVSTGMCEYLEKAYGARCLPLLPTADLESFKCASEARLATPAARHSPLRVVYTGSVYGAQLESLQRFVRALASLSSEQSSPLEIQFTLYTTATRRYLAKIGLDLPESVQCIEVRHDEIPRVLAESDVAFLPFSFDPGQRHIVETSLPSKIAEYLASGIPILAHAPVYSTVVRYCRENDCALIVDQPDEAALREALQRLGTDQALLEKLSRNAREAARRNHDARVLVPRFLAELTEAQNASAPK